MTTGDGYCSAAELIEHFYEGLRPPSTGSDAPAGLLDAGEVAAALLEIPDDELVGSTDADEVRAALSRALRRVAVRQGQREGLAGSGADGSIGGQRALGAVRNAIAATDLQAVVQNIRTARDPDAAERILAASLVRLDRAAAAELSSSTPGVWDAFRIPSASATATWLLPRDPHGVPRFWSRRAQRFEIEPRADRDWCVSNLGQVLGSGWRKQRAATFETIPQAEAWARSLPGEGDAFRRALEQEIAEERGEA